MDDNSCLDGSCKLRIGPLVGQHTNGGCRCLQDLQAKDRIRVSRKLHELKSRLAAWEEWGKRVEEAWLKEALEVEGCGLVHSMPEVK